MKRFSYLFLFVLALAQARVLSQETATGGAAGTTTPAAPAPATTDQPSGQLAPPADNAPAVSTTDTTTTTTTTTIAPAKTAPAKSTVALTPRELARIQQQEVIRRQELIFKANQDLADGQKAEVAQQYPLARQKYVQAAMAYGTISRATVSYAKAAEGLTRADFYLYDESLKIGDTARAKMLIDEIIQYNPNNKVAQEKEIAINRALANPDDTSLLGNQAITPGFVRKVNEVDRLFAEAEQFRRTGQWDEAEARLTRILGIDPYNKAATLQLERITKEKNKYDDTARLETRKERIEQVNEEWYEPIRNKDASSSAQQDQPVLIRATNFILDQKLKSVVLSLNFNNATIEEATSFLSIESKRIDPDHKGVEFIIQPKVSETAKPITLTLNSVPLGEALRYVCQLANVKYKVQDFAISIVPYSQSTDDMIKRTFIVQPSFVEPPMEASTESAAVLAAEGRRPLPVTPTAPTQGDNGAGDTVRQALETKGVKFPRGASVVYNPATGELTVNNTADQMDLIEELVNAGRAPILMVGVSAKFVEINQKDLNDLTINSAYNIFDPLAVTGIPHTGTTVTTALPGASGFSPNGIDTLLSPQPQNFNTLNLSGFISGNQFQMVIQALSQKKSFDLMTEPTALTKSGEQATLEAIRVFPYPIAFDPPTLVSQTNNQANGTGLFVVTQNPPAIIPTTPTDFKRRNVGVRLVIRPQVTADNKTIDLQLVPEVTDFEGFINYGSAILVSNPTDPAAPPALLSSNLINQPVFNTRRITTRVQIRDGATVVLGGLIREDRQEINDRVPILGDIPFIGRIFQSKATTTNKRNLIIFVTTHIYRNDGELLNPPEVANAADVLTGHASFTPIAHP